jgi:hypothetical protein
VLPDEAMMMMCLLHPTPPAHPQATGECLATSQKSYKREFLLFGVVMIVQQDRPRDLLLNLAVMALVCMGW